MARRLLHGSVLTLWSRDAYLLLADVQCVRLQLRVVCVHRCPTVLALRLLRVRFFLGVDSGEVSLLV